MSDYLLDTNVLRHWYDPRCAEHTAVVARVQVVRKPEPQTQYVPRLFVSVITIGEIEYGHRVTTTPDIRQQAASRSFVQEQCPQSLGIDRHVTGAYGELRAWLFNNCGPKEKRTKVKRPEQLVYPSSGRELGIDENDIWIAAQAMTFKLVLVTHDSRGNFGRLLSHFSSSLVVEDWAV
ncbi:MAG: hypothetical protein PHU85_15005 [Phycisphaerae bacterium]|nr:hypothetical protein [Phycisphaerae bacterium]